MFLLTRAGAAWKSGKSGVFTSHFERFYHLPGPPLHYSTQTFGGLSESEISHSMGNLVVRVGGYPVENVKNWCLEDDPLRSKWSLFRGHLLISQGAEAGNKRSILESYLRLSLFSRGCCSFKKILRNKHFTTQVYGVSGFY